MKRSPASGRRIVELAALVAATLLSACGADAPSNGSPDVDATSDAADTRDGQADGSGDTDASAPGDADGDGIGDELEDRNRNGTYDGGLETDWQSRDTDGDGIPDGTEDANRNGEVDVGETDPRTADTDGDGIADDDEGRQGTDPTDADSDDDGIPDGTELENGTDPNDPDSDDDGLRDGDEDRDGDGVIDEGETDPNDADTDGDGTPDGLETLAIACAVASEQPSQRTTSELGDWDWFLPASWITGDYGVRSGLTGPATRATFAGAPDLPLAGAIVSRAPAEARERPAEAFDAWLAAVSRRVRVPERELRPVSTWDLRNALRATVTLVFDGPRSSGGVLDELVAATLDRTLDDLPDRAPDGGEASARWTVELAIVRRSDDRSLFAMTARPTGASVPPAVVEAASTTSFGQFGDATENRCAAIVPEPEPAPVDFLWVVDNSESMLEDRETVAEAADVFFETLANSFLDFRIAVVSTNLRTNEWLVADPGFQRNLDVFRAEVRRPPVQFGDVSFEFGLETATNIIELAASNAAEPQARWRRDAARVLIFFSDEDAQSVEDLADAGDGRCSISSDLTLSDCPPVADFVQLLADESITAYAITGDLPSGCTSDSGPGFSEEPGAAYIASAFASGGAFASICADDLGAAVDGIVRAAIGAASVYALDDTPIAATLRVARNGALVARDPENGWTFDERTNRVAFHGDARPGIDDELAIGYRTWVDLTEDPTGVLPPE